MPTFIKAVEQLEKESQKERQRKKRKQYNEIY